MFLESTLLHPVWWSLGWSLSLKTAYVHISILDSTIILDLYHVCLSIAVSRYANFAFISSMFWMVPGEAWDVLCAKSLHFWNIPGEDLINQTVSTFLFVYLFISLSWECTFLVRLIWLLPGLSHQYSKGSTVVMLLYHWYHVPLLTGLVPCSGRGDNVQTTLMFVSLRIHPMCKLPCAFLNKHGIVFTCSHALPVSFSCVYVIFPLRWALVICHGWVSVGAQHPCE